MLQAAKYPPYFCRAEYLYSHSFPTVFLFNPDLLSNLIILFLRNVLLHAAALLRMPTPYARKRLSPSTHAVPPPRVTAPAAERHAGDASACMFATDTGADTTSPVNAVRGYPFRICFGMRSLAARVAQQGSTLRVRLTLATGGFTP